MNSSLARIPSRVNRITKESPNRSRLDDGGRVERAAREESSIRYSKGGIISHAKWRISRAFKRPRQHLPGKPVLNDKVQESPTRTL